MKLLPVLALACVLMATVHDCVAAQQSLFTIHQLPSSERPATLPASRPIVQVNGAVFSEVRALPDDAEVRIQLPVPDGQPLTLNLRRHRVISETTKIRAVTDQGVVTVAPPQSVHLAGIVEGHPESYVMMSVYAGYAVGTISMVKGAEPTYHLSPLNTARPAPIAVVLNSDLQKPEPWWCSTDDLPELPDRPVRKRGESTQAGSKYRIDIALECDYNYYLDHGSNLANATDYAEAVIAAVSALYDRDVDAVLNISDLTIFTTTDPYPGTTTATLLTQLRTYWLNNHTNVERSVVHLFSGINNIGGIAYLNGLCNNFGFGVSGLDNVYTYPRTTYAWDTEVTAHELGHNVGSRHTHSCTWNPALDSCYAAEDGNCFTQTVPKTGTIMSYCHLTTGGISLQFHPTVQILLEGKLEDATCLTMISDMTVAAGSDVSVCFGNSTTLSGTVSGGTTPYAYSWLPTTGLTGATTLTPVATPTTTTSYVLTVTDDLGVVRRDTVVVTVHPQITATMSSSFEVCGGEALALSLGTMGGTAPYTVRWTAPNVDTTTATGALTRTFATSGTLTAVITDAKNCTKTLTASLTVHPALTATMESTMDVCGGEAAILQIVTPGGTAPYSVNWKSAQVDTTVTGTSFSFVPVDDQLLTATITDANGCERAVTTQLIVLPELTPSVENTYEVCAGQPLTINVAQVGGTPPYTFAWSGSDVNVTRPDSTLTFVPQRNQTVALVVTDANACTRALSTNVVVLPSPTVTVGTPPTKPCPNQTFELEARIASQDPVTVTWYANNQSIGTGRTITTSTPFAVTYTAIAVTPSLCADTAAVFVPVRMVNVQSITASIAVPDLDPCENIFETTVTVINRGADTATLTGVTAAQGAAQSTALPRRLAPGAQYTLPVVVTLTGTTTVADTIIVAELCGSDIRIPIVGERSTIGVDISDGRPAFPTRTLCDEPVERILEVVVRNTTSSSATVQSARLQTRNVSLQVLSGASIPANNSTVVRLRYRGTVTDQNEADVLLVSYQTPTCEGTIEQTVDVPWVRAELTAPQELVFDDPISPALEDVRIDTSLRIITNKAWPARISNVQITGPFRTDLSVGATLPTNTDAPFTVWFRPSQMQADGSASGELRIAVDSCGWLGEPILLQAERRVVSVQEDRSEAIEHRMDGTNLWIRATQAQLTMVDAAGRVVLQRSINGEQVINTSHLAAGVYGLTVSSPDGSTYRATVMCW